MATLVLRRTNLWCVRCQSHPRHLASFCTWTETWENLNLIICCHGEEAVIEMPLGGAYEIIERNGRIDVFDHIQSPAVCDRMLPLEDASHQLLLGDHDRPLLIKATADSSQG